MNADVLRLRVALQVVLDQIDYTRGACTPTEMIGACMPKEVLEMAHDVLEATKE